MKQESLKQVRMNNTVNGLLNDISEKRREQDHLNWSKQGIVAELIISQHKKEVTQKKLA